MKKQRIKRGGFYGETIFNLAYYTLSRNYTIGKKNTKRAMGQYNVVTNYLENCKARQKEMAN